MSLLSELSRRKVFQAIAAYAIFSWLVVQIIVTIEEPLSLPDWTDTLIIALLAAGFPVALLLSWVFDLTRDGPVRTEGQDVSAIQKSTALTVGLLFIVTFLIGVHRLATGVWIFEQPDAGVQFGEQALVSTFPGSHTQPSLSPDGTMVAFVSDASGAPQVWVKNLYEGSPVQITHGEEPAMRPAWSPKNDQVLFHRRDGSLWTVGPFGTPEARKLIDSAINASFSRDGERIVFESGRRVFTARSDGSEVAEVGNFPERFFTSIYTQPTFSPDGQWLAAFVQSTGPNGDYWVVPLADGDARRLTFDVSQGGRPTWSADGEHIVFASRRGGTQTLWSVPFEGGDPVPVTTGVGEDSAPVISLDGSRVVYSNARVEYAIMLSDPATGDSHEVFRSRNSIYLPQPSPDGAAFTYFSETSSGAHVFVIDADGVKATQLTHGMRELNLHPEFSADGQYVYYYHNHPQQALRKVPAEGGPSTEVFANFTWQTHMRMSEDPSGQFIALTRMEPPDWSKDRNLVIDIATGTERVVASPHMHSPEWSNDGQQLIGSRHNGEIAICPVTGEDCQIIQSGGEAVLGGQPKWSRDESQIFFRRSGNEANMREAWVTNSDGSDARKVLSFGPLQSLNQNFEVTADDEILWVRYERGDDEIWMADIK